MAARVGARGVGAAGPIFEPRLLHRGDESDGVENGDVQTIPSNAVRRYIVNEYILFFVEWSKAFNEWRVTVLGWRPP